MDKILIIKLGALGDVIRTTPILRALKGDITWVTLPNAVPLLKRNPYVRTLLTIGNAVRVLKGKRYDLVLNLEEDDLAVKLAGGVKAEELVGVYAKPDGKKVYTDSSSRWFDMSLISKFGKAKADKLKLANRKSYQELLFRMVGKKFQGEEYVLVAPPSLESSDVPGHDVGIEARSGERWMAKRWPRVPDFIRILREKKMSFVKFQQYPTLDEFVIHVEKTDTVVTTDSLALHIALALKKKVAALFTCTSPWEIHGYARTEKVVSPLLERFFYSTAKTMKPGEAVSEKTVYEACKKLNS